MMITDRLVDALGLLRLQAKPSTSKPHHNTAASPIVKTAATPQQAQPLPQTKPADESPGSAVGKLDKDQFRLLAKMLQAINHDCTYALISYDGHAVTYQHPKKSLVFNDVNLPDSQQIMNLSSLSDLLAKPALKRPTWEKLKTLLV